MKFIWEAKDIKVGRKYSRQGIQEVWMIGYQGNAHTECRFVSVSMSDGLVTLTYTAEHMAENLTGDRYVPIEFLEPK